LSLKKPDLGVFLFEGGGHPWPYKLGRHPGCLNPFKEEYSKILLFRNFGIFGGSFSF